jgi:N-acetylglucosaminyldiphosphoundecaprenol N-acetyl-beta-D-mannosaminyltransferase
MHILIGRYKVSQIDVNNLTDTFTGMFGSGETRLVLYANAHTYLLAHDLPWLMAMNKKADLTLADGYGIVWAADMLGLTKPVLITLTYQDDLISKACIASKKSIYLLGGKSETAKKAAERLQANHPELQISGTHHGYIHTDTETKKVLAEIKETESRVLVLAMGSPIQEQWYRDNYAKLQGITTIMGGNCLSYWAGEDHKPPDYLTRNGYAWLHRTFQHPIRLLPRYIKVIPRFIVHILTLKWNARKKYE